MELKEAIEQLESAWKIGGLFRQIQTGRFNEEKAIEFIKLLQSIELTEENVPVRLVALLWKVPVFLRNQTDAVCSCGADPVAYMNFYVEVDFLLERLLGRP